MARRRGLGRLLLLLLVVVLAALLVGADRVARQVAERRTAAQLQTQLHTATPPTVDIQGFPFLTQALRRSFRTVRVRADDLKPAGAKTTVQHVDLTLHDVTSRDNFRTATARRVTGRATLDYPAVKELTGQSLQYAPDGLVQVSAPTTVMGVSVEAVVKGRPVVDQAAQTISLGEPQLSVDGVPVPQGTAKSLLDSVVKPAPVKDLPFGLRLTGVTAQPGGLEAALTGSDVTFGP